MTSVKVELPVGSSLSLEFAGAPPVLKSIHANSPLKDVPLHWYAQTVTVADVEYSYISDTQSLNELLNQFRDSPRTLTLHKTPLAGPPQVTITLPVGKELHMELNGFPPVVVSVNDKSCLSGKVPEGYVVDRLMFPPDKELSLATGGFTAANVNRALLESSHQEGRVMVLKKVIAKGDTVSSSRPFDFKNSFTNQSKWTVKRMFGIETKASVVKKGGAKNIS